MRLLLYNLAMNKKYMLAMTVRVIGIVLSVVSISIALFKPFTFVTNSLTVSGLLILAALLIMIGELIVINIGTSEEIKTRKQRGEAIYDVVTTGVVIVVYLLFIVVPFLNKYVW